MVVSDCDDELVFAGADFSLFRHPRSGEVRCGQHGSHLEGSSSEVNGEELCLADYFCRRGQAPVFLQSGAGPGAAPAPVGDAGVQQSSGGVGGAPSMPAGTGRSLVPGAGAAASSSRGTIDGIPPPAPQFSGATNYDPTSNPTLGKHCPPLNRNILYFLPLVVTEHCAPGIFVHQNPARATCTLGVVDESLDFLPFPRPSDATVSLDAPDLRSLPFCSVGQLLVLAGVVKASFKQPRFVKFQASDILLLSEKCAAALAGTSGASGPRVGPGPVNGTNTTDRAGGASVKRPEEVVLGSAAGPARGGGVVSPARTPTGTRGAVLNVNLPATSSSEPDAHVFRNTTLAPWRQPGQHALVSVTPVPSLRSLNLSETQLARLRRLARWARAQTDDVDFFQKNSGGRDRREGFVGRTREHGLRRVAGNVFELKIDRIMFGADPQKSFVRITSKHENNDKWMAHHFKANMWCRFVAPTGTLGAAAEVMSYQITRLVKNSEVSGGGPAHVGGGGGSLATSGSPYPQSLSVCGSRPPQRAELVHPPPPRPVRFNITDVLLRPSSKTFSITEFVSHLHAQSRANGAAPSTVYAVRFDRAIFLGGGMLTIPPAARCLHAFGTNLKSTAVAAWRLWEKPVTDRDGGAFQKGGTTTSVVASGKRNNEEPSEEPSAKRVRGGGEQGPCAPPPRTRLAESSCAAAGVVDEGASCASKKISGGPESNNIKLLQQDVDVVEQTSSMDHVCMVVVSEYAQTLVPPTLRSESLGAIFPRCGKLPGVVGCSGEPTSVLLPSGRAVSGHKLKFTVLEPG